MIARPRRRCFPPVAAACILPPMTRASWSLLPAVLLAPLLAACSSPGGSVTFTPLDGSTAQVQRFRQAYVSRAAAGEYDILLLDSPAENAYRRPKKNQPLQPVPIEPLQQAMHVHLYWTPIAGTEKNPAAINASITWYILGNETGDLLVYEGAGFVVFGGDSLSIRDGQIAPTVRRGNFTDPIGPSRLTGQAELRLNDSRVRDTVAQMQAIARQPGTVAEGP